jgi:hypothetical protein
VYGQLHPEAASLPGKESSVLMGLGRDISEAVSRWLPTAAARVRARVW